MMRLVADADELRDAVRRVARSGAGYTNNFFASPADTGKWIASGALSLVQKEQAVLILRRDSNFQRLYHVASGPAALSSALGILGTTVDPTTIVTDLIGRPESLKEVVNAHIENNFVTYTRLLRMTRLIERGLDIGGIEPSVANAGPRDAQHIRTFMDKQLDPFSEQIRTVAQLNDAIAKGTVLIMRQASELAGILIHDTTGLTATLRYWHVGEQFRNQGVGSRLIRAFFRLCGGGRRILLWVIEGNENAISKYRYYGFRNDSLIDNIMVRQAGPAQ